ncbi:MAG: endonuclease III [Armatimonadota bacterium]|nr:endonuclease III [Armatimonadota bacterium]
MAKSLRPRTFRRVDELLAERYGERHREPGDPLDTLVRTILSQNTTDKNSVPAFRRLKESFPDWQEALEAGPAAIEQRIESAGLAPTKSRRIHAILRQLDDQRGDLSLAHVCDMQRQEAERYLCSFKGVGPKTAAIVLLFDCGMAFFPVDTHVHRVSRRLGWIDEGDSAEDAYETLTDAVPEQLHLQLHLNMVRHGRETCHPSRPQCHDCVISRFCDAYKSGEVEPRER